MIDLLFKGRATRRLWIAFGLFLWTVVVLGLGAIVGLALAEKGIPISLESEDGRWRATVRSRVTLNPPRQDLLLTDLRDGAETRLAELSGEEERCVAVVWSVDSRRLAFLLDGTRLLVFDAEGAVKRFDDHPLETIPRIISILAQFFEDAYEVWNHVVIFDIIL